MVHVIIQDTSTVTCNGSTITGPVAFDASSVVQASTTYDSGTIVVASGTAVHTSELAREHVAAVPYAFLLFFFIGVHLTISWFRGASK